MLARMALLVALAGGAGAALANAPPASAACAPQRNLTAIVDDSGSMATTDPARLRVGALSAFVDQRSNSRSTLAAVEFGSIAGRLFAPLPIASSGAAMKSALDRSIAADNGGTDYNAAFAEAAALNPSATGRLFLTDGEHTEGAYLNGHRGGPPTHVIGLNVGSAGESLLRQIASETGGLFLPVNLAGDLGPAVNEITAVANCDPPPVEREIAAPAPGDGVLAGVGVGSVDRAVNTAIFTDDEIASYVIQVFDTRRDVSRLRALGGLLTWRIIMDSAFFGPGAAQSPGDPCRVRLRRLGNPARTRRPSPRLRVRCRAGAGFVLIDARARRGSLRRAVGPRLQLSVVKRRSAIPAPGRKLTFQFTYLSRSR